MQLPNIDTIAFFLQKPEIVIIFIGFFRFEWKASQCLIKFNKILQNISSRDTNVLLKLSIYFYFSLIAKSSIARWYFQRCGMTESIHALHVYFILISLILWLLRATLCFAREEQNKWSPETLFTYCNQHICAV